MTDDDIARRLDRMIAILQLANHDAIEKARATIRADTLNAAILDTAADWTPSGKLSTAVQRKEKGQSARTIARRIAALVDQGAVEKSGAGPSTKYKTTGLV